MRARSSALLMVALFSLLVPAAASAQTAGWVVADNPAVDCELPLPTAIVTGELGTSLVVSDVGEIDKVTLGADGVAEILDVAWHEDGRVAEITTATAISAYIVWSCAPVNGEPVQQNEPQEV